MKIELDLATLDTETGIRAGRCAAVLIMAMLPEDEARLAMQQWAAWREAEDSADQRAAVPPAGEAQASVQHEKRPEHPFAIGSHVVAKDGTIARVAGYTDAECIVRTSYSGPYRYYPTDQLRAATDEESEAIRKIPEAASEENVSRFTIHGDSSVESASMPALREGERSPSMASQKAAEPLPGLPRDVHASVAEDASSRSTATVQGQREKLRERIPAPGQAAAHTVSGVREPGQRDASSRLREASGGHVAMPVVPSSSALPACPENKPVETPDTPPSKPSYEKFTYGDRSFSVHKRGPKAALSQAFADILATTSPAELLGPVSLRLAALMGIFEAIGRKDLAEQIPPALEARKAELSGVAPTQPPQVEAQPELPETLPEPAESRPSAAPEGMVLYAGKTMTLPSVARAVCLRQIARCTTIEEVDEISRAADQLADQLDEIGQGALGTEIREALTKKTDKLVGAEEMTAQPAESQPVPAATLVESPPAPAQAGNGAGIDRAELVQLLRCAQGQLGTKWVTKLLRKYGATQVKGLKDDQLQAVWNEATGAVAG